MSDHWIRDEGGLRFKCTQCGKCCESSNGVVLVNERERERIARRLGMDIEDFERTCTWSWDENCRTLRTTPQGCILFDPYKRLCTVYGDHPLQCRTYPFWVGKIRTREDWENTCKECEGAGTPQGNFYPVERVRMLAVGTMRLNEQT